MTRTPNVPGYTDLQPIGEGGMGRVYAALDVACGRRVAIEVLPAASAEARERFHREVQVAARLSHPNLVPVFTAGTTREGAPFYVMELVTGPTLAEAAGELGLRTKVSLVARLARTLAYVHQHGSCTAT